MDTASTELAAELLSGSSSARTKLPVATWQPSNLMSARNDFKSHPCMCFAGWRTVTQHHQPSQIPELTWQRREKGDSWKWWVR
eukprot:91119-Amphidinium_carterae.1